MNGIKLVECEIGSADWEERKANSKFRGITSFGTYEQGLLCVQDHGDKVWFRNIKVRPLPLDAPECVIWPGKEVCLTADGGIYKDTYCLINPGRPECETIGIADNKVCGLKTMISITGSRLDISIKEPGPHSLNIYNLNGELIVSKRSTGAREYSLYPLGESGIYFVNVTAGNRKFSKRIVVLLE